MISRKKNRCAIYLRGKNTESLRRQMLWAIARAEELQLRANDSDDSMDVLDLLSIKQVYGQDNVSWDRDDGRQSPQDGLTELALNAWVDQSISHVLVQSPDRLGRRASDVTTILEMFRSLGVSVVLKDRVIVPDGG